MLAPSCSELLSSIIIEYLNDQDYDRVSITDKRPDTRGWNWVFSLMHKVVENQGVDDEIVASSSTWSASVDPAPGAPCCGSRPKEHARVS